MCNSNMAFKEFVSFINDNTTDYKFILYDNKSQTAKECDRFKIVKAKQYDNMKIKRGK